MMRRRVLSWMAQMALTAAALPGQPVVVPGTQPPVTGPRYWSATPPDCSSLAGESPVAIASASGTAGYSCYVSGTFVWVAAGGGWSTAIRVAAPASGAIGVDYSFYDGSGNNLRLDSAFSGSPAVSANGLQFALAANQPAEIQLLGATGEGPQYARGATGTAYAVFYCPDAPTCAEVTPQLLYSSLASPAWSTGAAIAWDTELATAWSSVGLDDGGANRLSLAIYNEDIAPASYRIRVFDSAGRLAASGATPFVPPLQSLPDGAYGEGGTYGALLSDAVAGPLPPGPFKIVVDGGASYCAVEVLQFHGASATGLLAGYDSRAALIAGGALQRADLRRSRVAARSRSVFPPLPVAAMAK